MKKERMIMRHIGNVLIVLIFLFGIAIIPVNAETLFQENFESGWGNWTPDNGVWEIGAPTIGPGGGHDSANCAGTILDGNYPRSTDSRLIYFPSILLPDVVGEEEILLRFWHWFSYGWIDSGVVQVDVFDEDTKTWSGWTSISNTIVDTSNVWSLKILNLTAYAGKEVKIAFYHTASSDSTVSTGWYIDDVEVYRKLTLFTGDFESGWGDWNADRGVWEVGAPTVGPGGGHDSANCAGTILDGNYPRSTDSRLISPSLRFPNVTGEEIRLRFWHWFSYGWIDSGVVQVDVFDEDTKTWSGWTSISNTIVDTSNVWSLKILNLTAYAGKEVKIAFYHTASSDSTVSTGWYIDDVEIDLPPCIYSILNTSQSFSSDGGSGSVNVSTSSGCPWTASSNAPSWINITSGSSGSGNGTVNYSVLPNTSISSRTGTITIAGKTVTVTQAGTNPFPDVKANGSDGPVTPIDNLSVTIALDPGSSAGVNADWWAVVNVSGTSTFLIDGWFYLDASTISWVFAGTSYTDLIVTHQGPLFDLATFEVLNISVSNLPSGTYTFYFAIDTNMNGLLDFGELYFDSVVVNITP